MRIVDFWLFYIVIFKMNYWRVAIWDSKNRTRSLCFQFGPYIVALYKGRMLR